MLGLGLFTLIWAGCATSRSAPAVPGESVLAATAQAATVPPSPSVGPVDDVMATVCGEPIPMSSLCELLIEANGLPLAQQLIAEELVRQESVRRGVDVTEKEIQAESDLTLKQMFPQIDQAPQREQLLAQLLQQRNMTPKVWQIVMRRNAHLRRMVADTVSIDQKQLEDEFAGEYGRKVRVRHIQVPTLQAAQEVLRRVNGGEDFLKILEEVSTSTTASEGGLLPPIGKTTPIPPAIREAALAMTEVGEVSQPVQTATAFHILKLEEIIKPQDVGLADVRGRIEDALLQRNVRNAQNALLMDLLKNADTQGHIQYVNPTLREQASQAKQSPSP